ncbi:FeoC-like transcriptional regulator [Thauera sinica]|uniref:FeoC-like transcriptional regulator n=1 Tax=Thauera sinica TaxID=2665146 RepID=A0ABW1AWR2_9RHOO|nr:FeoC-like transcriptional regulator [Thauera sp. K11]ATE61083.1 sugar metabolism transcriptional regulator [Thauera sp. K11]
MILSRLSNYLREHRRASLADMANGLDSTPEALEAMLGTLERKGRVKRLPPGSTCGCSCSNCDSATQTLYQWTGDGPAQ